jgi:hypothetical protein
VPRAERRDPLVADAMAGVVPERAIAFAGSARPVVGVMLDFVWGAGLAAGF